MEEYLHDEGGEEMTALKGCKEHQPWEKMYNYKGKVGWMMFLQIHVTWNLWILRYKAKDVIELRTSGWDHMDQGGPRSVIREDRVRYWSDVSIS